MTTGIDLLRNFRDEIPEPSAEAWVQARAAIAAAVDDEAATLSSVSVLGRRRGRSVPRLRDDARRFLAKTANRHRKATILAGVATVALLAGLLATVLPGRAGPVQTPWRAARSLPNEALVTARHEVNSWQLVSAVVNAQWQQDASGPPPGALTCPTTAACFAISGHFSSASANARATSESLYVSNDLGLTWSVLPLPTGFVSTTSLSCASAVSCAAGGTLNGQPVFITTADGGHQWVINAFDGPAGELLHLSCSSPTTCYGIVGPSSFNPANVDAYLRATNADHPNESFVTTTDGGVHWTSRSLAASEGVEVLDCMSVARCVVMGTSYPARHGLVGFALATSNGGTTWSRGMLPAGAATPVGLSCADDSHCGALVAVHLSNGSGSYSFEAIFSADGGLSWQPRPFPSSVPGPGITNIACPSVGRCWVSGFEAVPQSVGAASNAESPVLLGTTDGGVSWSKMTFTVPANAPNYDGQSYQAIGEISCPSPTNCIALGVVAQGSPSTPVYRIVAGK